MKATVVSSWQIRPATPPDVPAMVALERATPQAAHWQELAYGKLFSPDATPRLALVVEGAHRCLHGFVIASSTGEDWELENLAVRRECHRKGLGTQLIRSLIDSARAQGIKRIVLEVRESKHAACALYEKCGFTDSGRRRGYYANPAEDAVLYTFEL